MDQFPRSRSVIIALWVLGSLLIVAAFAIVMLRDKLAGYEKQLKASRSLADCLDREVHYWIGQSGNYQRRYELASQGLSKVQAIGTDNMANIGKRMSNIAVRANAAAKSLTFNKV